ncbi:general negative regulator of transcription subunit 5 [Didymosphaeria variabile]|uniref:General negative regulator of transcription subunit n=1 Tax=Didymosphaeria variabile TaxID=1932322 RepID=A0A9W9C8T4_9PLEO|nr:general negative regulator of transcription subunit 5 [Didymosphaeria variabile]KAJ4350059.1 general negative regulator of transcription subunit 5 [Didymosphaeria variabile]
MAQRKLQQEIDKCFKKVAEGVATFESIHEKIQVCTNQSQKEKLEDSLKKEIKKLQRSRDQIKTWATMSDIKDKKPLLDQRKLIETQMEKFKAVEKEMKTKAYSKEGLQLASKLDPKDKEKAEAVEFLQHMNEELDQQVERIEAEVEVMQATTKKGKKGATNAERIAELEEMVERHKWHMGKLELLQRALQNGNVETEQVKEVEEGIRYYVDSNQEPDFMEDDTMYDDFNLDEEEAAYGLAQEVDRVSSQDTQSIQDELPEPEPRSTSIGAKGKPAETAQSGARRSSTQLKSPLPALATLHTPLPGVSNAASSSMKPAPLPTRTPGEPLKYASAAAAAAASDKNGVGIAPLPPPPGIAAAQTGLAPGDARTSATTSPAPSHPQLASQPQAGTPETAPPAQPSKSPTGTPPTAVREKAALSRAPSSDSRKTSSAEQEEETQSATPPLTNGESHADDEEEEESIFHLPSTLQDLFESLEATKNDINASSSKPPDERMLAASMATAPNSADTEAPRHYRPQNPYPYTPAHYPQEPLAIFDDPRLYSRIETDALFYAFYYRQGTYQQYLAAKALKSQSWRFHKQYQTWFQRHEEPKAITEDYEQGTYRFFDYESTWMNRRKADFRFAYKFLEDEL